MTHPFAQANQAVALEAMIEARELLEQAVVSAEGGFDVEEMLDGVAEAVQRAKNELRKAKAVEQEVG